MGDDLPDLLFRDTATGGQPTVWSMWTLSQKLGTPQEVSDLDAFLANAPGNKVRPASEIQGDRFTAIGQFDVDVEYYIARPSDTPRHTLRWGYTGYNTIDRHHNPNPWHEFQDLLHLQLPGDGAYFVAFFPRQRTEPHRLLLPR